MPRILGVAFETLDDGYRRNGLPGMRYGKLELTRFFRKETAHAHYVAMVYGDDLAELANFDGSLEECVYWAIEQGYCIPNRREFVDGV